MQLYLRNQTLSIVTVHICSYDFIARIWCRIGEDKQIAGEGFIRETPSVRTMNRVRDMRPHHLLLQWHVTERCDLHCAHCYQSDDNQPEMSWEQCLLALEQFTRLLGHLPPKLHGERATGHITLTGGDPFVRGDFMQLLEHIARRREDFSFAILTHGQGIDRALADALSSLKPTFVQISIEGDKQSHEQVRGVGSFDKAIAGIKELIRAGVRVYTAFTAHRLNFRQFPEVAKIGRSLGVARVWADRMVPLGRGASMSDMMLTPEETREFVEMMAHVSRRFSSGRTDIAMHRALQFIGCGGQPYRCSAGDGLITLLPNGDLCPCRRMPRVVGNIFKADMSEIYLTNDVLRSLRGHSAPSKGCERCFYAQTCGGGLRCLSSAVYGSTRRADPGCWIADQSNVRPAEEELPPCSAKHDYCVDIPNACWID